LRQLHGGKRALAERLEQGRYKTAKNTVIRVPAALLHPGAVRYFREAGVNRFGSRLIDAAIQAAR